MFGRAISFAAAAFLAACGAETGDSSASAVKFAGGDTVTFTGQGFLADGFGGYDLRTELCGVENGADAEGAYLLWVLTATGASGATITGPWGTEAMDKISNGTLKFVSGWYDPDALVAFPVSATFTGNAKNPQLVVSHGCRPSGGGWCSPGFWRNATEDAWALTGHSRTDLFNGAVYDYWYGATFAADPTLDTVLTTDGGTYKGSPVPGTSGYALNAFNATGAMLTDAIPGVSFDFDVMQSGSSEACPIDHFGHFKEEQ